MKHPTQTSKTAEPPKSKSIDSFKAWCSALRAILESGKEDTVGIRTQLLSEGGLDLSILCLAF
jgi:hypothetical protein